MKILHIQGRKWFEKVNGNTYHTVEIWIDGEWKYKSPVTYGYGNHYQQTALLWLEENGYLPDRNTELLWTYCNDHSIKFNDSVDSFPRKKDIA